MERIPVEIIATISEYLHIVDIFSLLHLNKSLNNLWRSTEYWSIICRGGKNYARLLADEFNIAIEELNVSNLSNGGNKQIVDSEEYGKHVIMDSCSFVTGIQNSIKHDKNSHITHPVDRSMLWKVFVRKRLQSLNLVQITSIFQDVNVYRCDKKIISVFSPLIVAISDNYLEIYELRNVSCLNKEIPCTDTKRLIDISKILITRLNVNILNDSGDKSKENCVIKDRTIIKWAFFNKNTIICISKDYGIYIHEVNNFSERKVLKKPILGHCSSTSSVIMFEISGNLLAVGLRDGSLDIWKLHISGSESCKSIVGKWQLLHHSTVKFEHKYPRNSLGDVFDEMPSPLTWANISHSCNILLAIYKGIINEIRIFSIDNLGLNNNPLLLHKIPLQSDVQTCQIDPRGRFIICVDSNKEFYPKTRFYSLSSGKLLLTQNFRIICPIFTPCGHWMIGAYRAHSILPFEKSIQNFKSSRVSPRHINNEFMNSYFISIWGIPSLKEIYSFNCGVSEQIINIRFSRTRCSTTIVTTTINRNNSDCIYGSAFKTYSNIYFISHDIFASIKPMNLSYFTFGELQ
ncbi:hypothetical protein OJ252_3388 [Cryptosporidium canis]|uniref:F-box domain-containing protein n=1 Tax=Cryptosporidium canis TaxID=195482 RepID=A0ABQ8P2H0_9CRYT|nr:hypothetical protein OJ252_3388 [Cryptosporidium canis]